MERINLINSNVYLSKDYKFLKKFNSSKFYIFLSLEKLSIMFSFVENDKYKMF